MRVVIVCTYYPWPPSVGGVEAIVRNIAVQLAKRGHEVHIVTTPLDVTTGKPVASSGVEERDGVLVHKLKPSWVKIGYARIIHGLREEIAKIKPNVVHAHNLHPHLFQLAKWKKELKYKLIAELHHPAIELDFLIQKLVFPYAVFGLRLVSKRIDSFIAHTEIEKKWLVNKGIGEYKVHVARLPGIRPELLNTPIKSSRQKDVIYIGRIVPRKGLHVLIRAASKVKEHTPNVGVTIAGPTDPKYFEKLVSLAKRLRLENTIVFKNYIPEEEKYKLLKEHKVFVLPSLKDYTPNIVLEAQALGTAVISTKVGAIPEIVLDGETGILVEPGNVEHLAEAVKILLSNEKVRKRMFVKAREFAKNFTLGKVINHIEKIYNQLVST